MRSKAQDSLFATALRLAGGLGSVGAESPHGSGRGFPPVAALPGHARAVFQLQLSGFHKRRIVFLGNLDTAVAQQQRNLIERNAREQQFDREGVAEHVRMAALRQAVFARQIQISKKEAQRSLPSLLGGMVVPIAAPEDISRIVI